MPGELEPSWKEILINELQDDYMLELREFLKNEQKNGHIIYPPNRLIFNAFNHTPFDEVKIVILGQDPYHGQQQAHGLSFSVQNGVPVPPSLQNIFKELKRDIPGFHMPAHGDLTAWADQGVLLLNATLTVESSKPGSHQKRGWEKFTDKVIAELSRRRSGIVFMLWGKYAQSKAGLIDSSKHYILTAAHPSPLSAHNGFVGCRHFSKANEYLKNRGLTEINWQL
ncbi:uracil-DNA glycosylase [Flavihumibacter sp. R14]|nr:uracil-DNA glycosylase [Flavihumibacter soli]